MICSNAHFYNQLTRTWELLPCTPFMISPHTCNEWISTGQAMTPGLHLLLFKCVCKFFSIHYLLSMTAWHRRQGHWFDVLLWAEARWRAQPADGLTSYTTQVTNYYFFFSVSNNEALAAIEGNPFRDVWKAACWKMSQEVHLLQI